MTIHWLHLVPDADSSFRREAEGRNASEKRVMPCGFNRLHVALSNNPIYNTAYLLFKQIVQSVDVGHKLQISIDHDHLSDGGR